MTKQNADPLNVNARLYRQVSKLLDDLEAPPVKKRRGKTGKDEPEDDGVTMRERIAALTAIARIQTIFIQLRAEDNSDERRAGSAVRRYAGAFKNAGGGRKARRGSAAIAAADEPASDDDFAGDDEPGDSPDAAE